MRYDRQKAFPYPVLRPDNDDYIDCEIQATAIIDNDKEPNELFFTISYSVSSGEITTEISKGNAEYVSIISCRDTYFMHVIATAEKYHEMTFPIGKFRGEVIIESYVVVRKTIDAFISEDINAEFGPGPFKFTEGDILAQDEPQVFYIDRDLFRPVTAVFELVKSDDLDSAEWKLSYSQNHVQIELSPSMKEKIDNARNSTSNQAVLINSIYFAAVMQSVQILKESNEYDDLKWASVIRSQAHNKGCDIDKHEAYIIAERLMKYPLNLLDSYVFKGGE